MVTASLSHLRYVMIKIWFLMTDAVLLGVHLIWDMIVLVLQVYVRLFVRMEW